MYSEVQLIMHPARPSEARLGGVHFFSSPHSELYQVTTGELLKVTMYTEQISLMEATF